MVTGTRRRLSKPPPPGVTHDVDLGHVDQLDDRLAGRRAQSLLVDSLVGSSRRRRRAGRRRHRQPPPPGPPPPPPPKLRISAILCHSCSICSSVMPAFLQDLLLLLVAGRRNNCVLLFAGESWPIQAGSRALARPPLPAALPAALPLPASPALAGERPPRPPRLPWRRLRRPRPRPARPRRRSLPSPSRGESPCRSSRTPRVSRPRS